MRGNGDAKTARPVGGRVRLIACIVAIIAALAAIPGLAVAHQVDEPTLPTPSTAVTWWNANWAYRMAISVDTAGVEREDTVFEVTLNFSTAISDLAGTGLFDPDSIRIVEVDAAEGVLDENVPLQFDPAPSYDPATNAVGVLLGQLTGTTPAATTRFFHVYFATTGASTTPSSTPDQVVLTDPVVDEGQDSLAIATASTTWFYQKDAGGFSSVVDTNANDWVNYSTASGSAGAFRGIPNAVFPEGHFHPGATSSTTTVLHSGPLRETFVSTATGGWEAHWHVYPQFARMDMTAAPANYWVLYEGTPGGAIDLTTDRIVYSDGTDTSISTQRASDLIDPEWAAFVDPVVGRSLVTAHLDGDTSVDWYRLLNNEMTVWGFGRGTGLSRHLTGQRSFLFGLTDDTVFSSIDGQVADWRVPPTLTVTALQARPGPSCGGQLITVDLSLGQSPTSGDDVIVGTANADVINAMQGNDVVCAGDGDDTVFGMDGDDTIFGEGGNDQILGFGDNDTLYGGPGDDILNGGVGDDNLSGDNGEDTLYGQDGNDELHGGADNDLILGFADNDVMTGGEGDDVMNSGPGNDSIEAGSGNDTVFAGPGNDTLVSGGDGDDLLFGQPGADTLDGGAGNDSIWGNEGNDVATDPSGTNVLNGGPGNDTLTGGSGPDTLYGDGNLSQGGDDILDGAGGVDFVLGFAGDDTITSNDGIAETINAGPHNAGDSCLSDPVDTVFNCP